MIFLTIASVLGCIYVKNKTAKILLGIFGGILLAFLLLIIFLIYLINYAIADVDTKVSDDGNYTVIMQSVGSPLFFSSADGRFVLKEGKKTIVKYDFTLSDDGGSIRSSIWDVEWLSDCVRIVVSGSEQSDEQYELYFDGHVDEKQLGTMYGKSIEKGTMYGDSDSTAENDTEAEFDVNGYPLTDEFQAYKEQMIAIDKYIKSQGKLAGVQAEVSDFQCEFFLSAKGWPYAVIYRETTDMDGSIVYEEHRLVYNESYQEDGTQEYVYEQFYFDENGSEVQSTKIVDFFLVDTETLVVTDENKINW
jgi:hypothetical protein